MRILIAGIATSLVVVGCQAADPNAALKADCDILVTDPEAQENIADMGTDEAGFCGCMIDMVSAKSETDQAQIFATMETVTDLMEETGEGAEDVVSKLIRDAMMSPGEEASEALRDGINKVGRLIDDIGDGFEDGACKAID